MSTDTAWLAGFYEGEGTVGSYEDKRGRKSFRSLLAFSQKHIEPLQRVMRILDEEDIKYGFWKDPKSGQMYVQISNVEDMLEVLNMMWPQLSEWRKDQARDAILKRTRLPFWMEQCQAV